MHGMRLWRVREEALPTGWTSTSGGGPRLWSVWAPYAWPRGIAEASHYPESEDVTRPGEDHCPNPMLGCGFWAITNPLRFLNDTLAGYSFGAYGIIAGYGRIQVHQDGFRAQRAQILRVFLLPGLADQAEALANYYECEVEPAPHQHDLEPVWREYIGWKETVT